MVGAIFLLIILTRVQFQAKELNVEIKLLEPRGISISIPTDDGIEAFYFWGNINEKASIRLGAVQPIGGRWVIRNEDLELKGGDVISYVVLVKKHGEFERQNTKRFEVPGSKQSKIPGSTSTTLATPPTNAIRPPSIVTQKPSHSRTSPKTVTATPPTSKTTVKYMSRVPNTSSSASRTSTAPSTKSPESTIPNLAPNDLALSTQVYYKTDIASDETKAESAASVSVHTLQSGAGTATNKLVSSHKSPETTLLAGSSGIALPSKPNSKASSGSDEIRAESAASASVHTLQSGAGTATNKFVLPKNKPKVTSSTSVPLEPASVTSTDEMPISLEKQFLESNNDCSHRINLQSDDFILDFYGNIDINNINPKMIAGLVIDDCQVKYLTVEQEEPSIVEFHIS